MNDMSEFVKKEKSVRNSTTTTTTSMHEFQKDLQIVIANNIGSWMIMMKGFKTKENIEQI